MKKKELQSVEAALLESTITYFDTHNAKGMAVGGERNAVLKIKDIEKLVKEIVANDEIHFYEKDSRGLARAELTGVGKRLLINVWAWEGNPPIFSIHQK